MRKHICAVFLLALMAARASAAQGNPSGQASVITGSWINSDPQAQAEMLQKLGLLQGTDKGFELDREMTRAEGAAMLCRFLGGAEEAAQGGFTHPFDDVPAWADGAVGWLYENKLTYGISDTQYGAAQPLEAGQFACFLSRAMCGDDSFSGQMLPGKAAEAFRDGRGFQRKDAVAMSVCAFAVWDGNSDETFAKRLADKGVFTAEQFGEAAWGVLTPEYDSELNVSVAGIPYASRAGEGFVVDSVTAGPDCGLPYFYATRKEDGRLVYYQIDRKTLRETAVGAQDGAPYRMSYYIQTVGGTDYLWENVTQPDDTGRYQLLAVRDSELSIVLNMEDLFGAGFPDALEDGGFAVTADKGVYVVTEEGIRLQEEAAKKEVLWTDGTLAVTQSITNTETTIELSDNAAGEVLQSYSAPQDVRQWFRKVQPDEDSPEIFYGEAGLYERQGRQLIRYYEGAAVDFAVADVKKSCFYIVTHDAGERFHGMGDRCGTRLIRIPYRDASVKEEVVLGDDLGLKITYLEYQDGKLILFQCEETQGSYYGFTYQYDLKDGKLTVTDFSNPSEEKAGDGTGQYKYAYIEAEQARLDAIL